MITCCHCLQRIDISDYVYYPVHGNELYYYEYLDNLYHGDCYMEKVRLDQLNGYERSEYPRLCRVEV